jgi:sporulation protein YlmC with PRC-barrel domain
MMRHEQDDNSRTMDRSRGRDDRDNDHGMFGRGRDRERYDYDDRGQDHQPSSGDLRHRRGRHGPRGHDERDPEYGPDAYREGMPRNETERLIASSKVEGTPVYDRNGRKLGTICTLMLDKRSGHTEYAVLRYNSEFLGLSIKERYYPLDWRELTYDRRVHGYGVEFTEDQLDDRVGYDSDGRRVGRRDGRPHEARFAAWS